MLSDKHALRTRQALSGVDPRLSQIVKLALDNSDVPFIVTEGQRSKKRQVELYEAGATRTLNSKHLSGRAIDVAALVGGEIRWDWPLYLKIAKAIKAAAKELGIRIVWGGDWRSFKDGPHFELVD